MSSVSVVVPSYNGSSRLPRLMSSLAKQQGVEWEAIIVLDGSTDNSKDVVARWADVLPVRCIQLSRNWGRPTALNAGFSEANGQVLVRCDDDLELPENFLANHSINHRGDPVGVVGMCIDVFPDTLYARSYGRQANEDIRRMAYSTPSASAWRFWAANCSVTRSTYDRVGIYDESFREYGWEDIDWGYRLHKLGIPIVVLQDVEALHHNPALSGRDRSAKAFASGASRRLFESKHPESELAQAVLDAPWSPWNVAVRATAAWMRARSVGGVAAILDAVADHTPPPVARKLISLGVEAAGLAGRRAPTLSSGANPTEET